MLVYFAVVCSLIATAMAVVVHHRSFGLAVDGLEDGAVVRADVVREAGVTADDPSTLDRVDVFVDGEEIATRRDGDRLRLTGFDPAEGEHTVRVRVRDTTLLGMEAEIEHAFTVDDTAPDLAVDRAGTADPRSPVTIRGTAVGAESVRVAGSRATLVGDAFEATVPSSATVFVEARDSAGNTTRRRVAVPAHRPETRVMRLGADDWASGRTREAMFRRARQGEIDTVVLDVKDEDGRVPHRSEVPLARRIGAIDVRYDPRAAVREIHGAGLRAVARVVAFRDPVLARASWRAGMRDHVRDGSLVLTNPAHPEVRGYVVALAREAVALGFDDVVLDHVGGRAAEGFLAEAWEAVRAGGARLGAVLPQGAEDVDFVVPGDTP